jgi:hypothetical protein
MLMSGEIPRRHHRTTAHAEDGPSTYIASHDLHTYGEINRLRRQPTAVAIRKLGYDNAHEIAQLCRCRAARGLIHLVEPRRNVSRIALGRHVVDPKRRRSEVRQNRFANHCRCSATSSSAIWRCYLGTATCRTHTICRAVCARAGRILSPRPAQLAFESSIARVARAARLCLHLPIS